MTTPVLKQKRALVAATHTDPGAFAVLYEHHVDRVYAYAWHCLHDGMAAEDVVAETFDRALHHLPPYAWSDGISSTWLYRMASQAIATRYRPSTTLPLEAAGGRPDRDPGPAARALHRERRRALQTAVAALPLLQHQVLSLYYGQDLCCREIAVILGRSEGAIKQALHRARRRLRHRLAARAGDEEGR